MKKIFLLIDTHKEFVRWGLTQINQDGNLFSKKVIGNYTSALETVFEDNDKKIGPIEGVDFSSVFECKDQTQFKELRSIIENHPRFKESNEKSHHNLSSGLALYEKFLEYCYTLDYANVFQSDHYTELCEKEYKNAKKFSIEELKKRILERKDQEIVYVRVESRQIKRDQEVVCFALDRAKGICDLCGRKAPFLKKDGEPYLECHHVKWLSKGGADTIDNVVALCPNCHKECHVANSNAITRKLNQQLKRYKENGQA